MAKKTKRFVVAEIVDAFEMACKGFYWPDILVRYLTRAELERIAKNVRKDLER
jgi:hypothetical protein